ncbi:hypothetical protein BJ912DRAFT_994505 [Pholiota molesta]|nr:hypothetical protein BJ912DRAFT_994505 [Pholiota molesta]
MLSKLLSRLKSIFVPMSPPASPAYEVPKARFLPFVGYPQDTKGYIRHIICQIHSGNGPEWKSLSKHRVVKLEYCKNMADGDKPEHEFLVATVVDHNGTLFRLQIERIICPSDKTLTPVEPKETTHGFLTLLMSEQPSRAKDTVSSPLAFVAAIYQAVALVASRSVASLDSTVSSSSEASSESLIAQSGPAYDMVSRLGPSDVYPPGVVILRSFEPSHNSLSLLHLAMIIEAVHDAQPEYHVLTANCYWFAMMIMGISMLQGGYVQVVGKTSPTEDESLEPPPQVFVNPHTSGLDTIPAANEGDIEVQMPIPTPKKDDIAVITNGAGAGTKTVVLLGAVEIVKASFKDIWKVGRQSQNHYDTVYGYLKSRRSTRELVIEAGAQGEARGEARKQIQVDALQRENEDLRRQVWTLTRGSTQSEHAGPSIPRSSVDL